LAGEGLITQAADYRTFEFIPRHMPNKHWLGELLKIK